ncbi:MAG: D-glycero-beta-D-manno-heptose 1-phosphate adenylyltransferase [Ponticaulis sp.]|nr:D-glycero-beta-D-manno-heptose 1-phosphate adenylyltransferase [Ponticaulis sp.]
MLDHFVYGSVSRISPEAPIPVLRKTSAATMLGAVGNVARNVASLKSNAVVLSIVGPDEAAESLDHAMAGWDNLDGHLLRETGRETTVKTRYIAGSQQLLRVDHESTTSVISSSAKDLCQLVAENAKNANAILLSDYAKGVVTDEVIAACLESAERYSIPLIVDPKGVNFEKYGAVDLIKPNASELSAYLGRPLSTDLEIEEALKDALKRLSVKAILVTRSDKGLSFLKRGGTVRHLPAEKREVYDVSGAGDTSLAAIGIALASGKRLDIAAQFALIAAGIVVGKSGTATVSNQEIRAMISQKRNKSVREKGETFSTLELVQAWKAEGLSVGFTNGCFDILHAGHLSLLDFAASKCDRLVVGLNSDASVRRLKGETRPINIQADRKSLLLGLKSVSAVETFDEDTPKELIDSLVPDLLVKGGDYTIETIVGADVVINNGGKVLIAPLLEGRSTTSIIEKSQTD